MGRACLARVPLKLDDVVPLWCLDAVTYPLELLFVSSAAAFRRNDEIVKSRSYSF